MPINKPDRFAPMVERKIKNLPKLDLSESNRKAILDFSNFCYTEGLSHNRVLKYLTIMPRMARMLEKDFEDAARPDIERVLNQIERSDYSEWTKHDYRVGLKKFFRWLRKTDDYPPEVKWIKSTTRGNRLRLPEELLTQSEVQSLIIAAKSVRDKALISTLYESGCRISELLELQMRQVHKHPHGFQITVFGKKGPRRLLLITSAVYLTDLINQHPKRDYPSAYLWLSDDYRAAQLLPNMVGSMLKKIAKRAGVTKAVNPHNFRHSRATHLAKHLTESQLSEYMGWVQGSNMPATYVHLSGRDVDNALLKLNNIPVEEDDSEHKQFTLKDCPRCKKQNPPANKYCSTCGTPLDEQAAREAVTKDLDRNRADNIMDILIQDPEFREILERKLREIGNIDVKSG